MADGRARLKFPCPGQTQKFNTYDTVHVPELSGRMIGNSVFEEQLRMEGADVAPRAPEEETKTADGDFGCYILGYDLNRSDALSAGPEGILVRCGGGSLLLTEVQMEGKKRMAAADFLRGHAVIPGEILG